MALFTYDNTTVIKAVAILCVFFCHLGNQFTRFTTPLGGIGVCMFLIISGYGLEKSFITKKNNMTLNNRVGTPLHCWWYKRIISVWIPYWIISACFLPLKKYDNIIDMFFDLSLIKPNFRLGWYLNYLLLWYITFWVLHKFVKNENLRLILLYLVTIGFMLYYGFTSSIRFEQSFSFVIGVVMANYEKQFKRFFKCKIIIALLTTGIILLGLKQTTYVRNMPEVIINILNLVMKESVGIGLVIGVVVASKINVWRKEITLICKILAPIGMTSYELYLVHGFALKIFDVQLPKYLLVVMFSGISVVGTIALYFVDKKVTDNLKKLSAS